MVQAMVIHSPLQPDHEDDIIITYRPEEGDNTSVVRLTYVIDDDIFEEVELFQDDATGNFSHDIGDFPPGTRISYSVVAWNRTVGQENITVSTPVEVLWNKDLDEGKALGMAIERPVMIFFHDDRDKDSYRMFMETFSDERVINMSSDLVAIRVDTYFEPDNAHLYGITETPAVVFLDKGSKEIHRISGFVNGDKMVQHLKYILGKGPRPDDNLPEKDHPVVLFLVGTMAAILVAIGIVYLLARRHYGKY